MKPQIMTRRDFLRLSGLSAATLVAGGGFASFLSRCAVPGGFWSKKHANSRRGTPPNPGIYQGSSQRT
jgi:hypothetical protein